MDLCALPGCTGPWGGCSQCEQGNQGPANFKDPTRCIPGSGQASRAKIFYPTVVLGHAAFLWHSRVLPLRFSISTLPLQQQQQIIKKLEQIPRNKPG